MISKEILYIVLLLILFIIILDRLGGLFKRLSPKTLKYIDYGSFATAVITGLLMYFGHVGGGVIRYIFFLSIIVYFITLRHTAHNDSSLSGRD